MNQDKLDVIKQEMAKVNIDILEISELKWTGMREFNSDDPYIYYCGQESLRRDRIALIVSKRVLNAVLFSASLPLLLCLPHSFHPTFGPDADVSSFPSEGRINGKKGGRDFRTCKGTDNPRASPPRAIATASYPKATSRSPLASAPSGLPKMPAFEP